MPYIPFSDRSRAEFTPRTPGELNFALTRLCLDYLERTGVCYQSMNDCVGALQCASLELYRRVIAPYEDEKRERNGDVYP